MWANVELDFAISPQAGLLARSSPSSSDQPHHHHHSTFAPFTARERGFQKESTSRSGAADWTRGVQTRGCVEVDLTSFIWRSSFSRPRGVRGGETSTVGGTTARVIQTALNAEDEEVPYRCRLPEGESAGSATAVPSVEIPPTGEEEEGLDLRPAEYPRASDAVDPDVQQEGGLVFFAGVQHRLARVEVLYHCSHSSHGSVEEAALPKEEMEDVLNTGKLPMNASSTSTMEGVLEFHSNVNEVLQPFEGVLQWGTELCATSSSCTVPYPDLPRGSDSFPFHSPSEFLFARTQRVLEAPLRKREREPHRYRATRKRERSLSLSAARDNPEECEASKTQPDELISPGTRTAKAEECSYPKVEEEVDALELELDLGSLSDLEEGEEGEARKDDEQEKPMHLPSHRTKEEEGDVRSSVYISYPDPEAQNLTKASTTESVRTECHASAMLPVHGSPNRRFNLSRLLRPPTLPSTDSAATSQKSSVTLPISSEEKKGNALPTGTGTRLPHRIPLPLAPPLPLSPPSPTSAPAPPAKRLSLKAFFKPVSAACTSEAERTSATPPPPSPPPSCAPISLRSPKGMLPECDLGADASSSKGSAHLLSLRGPLPARPPTEEEEGGRDVLQGNTPHRNENPLSLSGASTPVTTMAKKSSFSALERNNITEVLKSASLQREEERGTAFTFATEKEEEVMVTTVTTEKQQQVHEPPDTEVKHDQQEMEGGEKVVAEGEPLNAIAQPSSLRDNLEKKVHSRKTEKEEGDLEMSLECSGASPAAVEKERKGKATEDTSLRAPLFWSNEVRCIPTHPSSPSASDSATSSPQHSSGYQLYFLSLETMRQRCLETELNKRKSREDVLHPLTTEGEVKSESFAAKVKKCLELQTVRIYFEPSEGVETMESWMKEESSMGFTTTPSPLLSPHTEEKCTTAAVRPAMRWFDSSAVTATWIAGRSSTAPPAVSPSFTSSLSQTPSSSSPVVSSSAAEQYSDPSVALAPMCGIATRVSVQDTTNSALLVKARMPFPRLALHALLDRCVQQVGRRAVPDKEPHRTATVSSSTQMVSCDFTPFGPLPQRMECFSGMLTRFFGFREERQAQPSCEGAKSKPAEQLDQEQREYAGWKCVQLPVVTFPQGKDVPRGASACFSREGVHSDATATGERASEESPAPPSARLWWHRSWDAELWEALPVTRKSRWMNEDGKGHTLEFDSPPSSDGMTTKDGVVFRYVVRAQDVGVLSRLDILLQELWTRAQGMVGAYPKTSSSPSDVSGLTVLIAPSLSAWPNPTTTTLQPLVNAMGLRSDAGVLVSSTQLTLSIGLLQPLLTECVPCSSACSTSSVGLSRAATRALIRLWSSLVFVLLTLRNRKQGREKVPPNGSEVGAWATHRYYTHLASSCESDIWDRVLADLVAITAVRSPLEVPYPHHGVWYDSVTNGPQVSPCCRLYGRWSADVAVFLEEERLLLQGLRQHQEHRSRQKREPHLIDIETNPLTGAEERREESEAAQHLFVYAALRQIVLFLLEEPLMNTLLLECTTAIKATGHAQKEEMLWEAFARLQVHHGAAYRKKVPCSPNATSSSALLSVRDAVKETCQNRSDDDEKGTQTTTSFPMEGWSRRNIRTENREKAPLMLTSSFLKEMMMMKEATSTRERSEELSPWQAQLSFPYFPIPTLLPFSFSAVLMEVLRSLPQRLERLYAYPPAITLHLLHGRTLPLTPDGESALPPTPLPITVACTTPLLCATSGSPPEMLPLTNSVSPMSSAARDERGATLSSWWSVAPLGFPLPMCTNLCRSLEIQEQVWWAFISQRGGDLWEGQRRQLETEGVAPPFSSSFIPLAASLHGADGSAKERLSSTPREPRRRTFLRTLRARVTPGEGSRSSPAPCGSAAARCRGRGRGGALQLENSPSEASSIPHRFACIPFLAAPFFQIEVEQRLRLNDFSYPASKDGTTAVRFSDPHRTTKAGDGEVEVEQWFNAPFSFLLAVLRLEVTCDLDEVAPWRARFLATQRRRGRRPRDEQKIEEETSSSSSGASDDEDKDNEDSSRSDFSTVSSLLSHVLCSVRIGLEQTHTIVHKGGLSPSAALYEGEASAAAATSHKAFVKGLEPLPPPSSSLLSAPLKRSSSFFVMNVGYEEEETTARENGGRASGSRKRGHRSRKSIIQAQLYPQLLTADKVKLCERPEAAEAAEMEEPLLIREAEREDCHASSGLKPGSQGGRGAQRGRRQKTLRGTDRHSWKNTSTPRRPPLSLAQRRFLIQRFSGARDWILSAMEPAFHDKETVSTPIGKAHGTKPHAGSGATNSKMHHFRTASRIRDAAAILSEAAVPPRRVRGRGRGRGREVLDPVAKVFHALQAAEHRAAGHHPPATTRMERTRSGEGKGDETDDDTESNDEEGEDVLDLSHGKEHMVFQLPLVFPTTGTDIVTGAEDDERSGLMPHLLFGAEGERISLHTHTHLPPDITSFGAAEAEGGEDGFLAVFWESLQRLTEELMTTLRPFLPLDERPRPSLPGSPSSQKNVFESGAQLEESSEEREFRCVLLQRLTWEVLHYISTVLVLHDKNPNRAPSMRSNPSTSTTRLDNLQPWLDGLQDFLTRQLHGLSASESTSPTLKRSEGENRRDCMHTQTIPSVQAVLQESCHPLESSLAPFLFSFVSPGGGTKTKTVEESKRNVDVMALQQEMTTLVEDFQCGFSKTVEALHPALAAAYRWWWNAFLQQVSGTAILLSEMHASNVEASLSRSMPSGARGCFSEKENVGQKRVRPAERADELLSSTDSRRCIDASHTSSNRTVRLPPPSSSISSLTTPKVFLPPPPSSVRHSFKKKEVWRGCLLLCHSTCAGLSDAAPPSESQHWAVLREMCAALLSQQHRRQCEEDAEAMGIGLVLHMVQFIRVLFPPVSGLSHRSEKDERGLPALLSHVTQELLSHSKTTSKHQNHSLPRNPWAASTQEEFSACHGEQTTWQGLLFPRTNRVWQRLRQTYEEKRTQGLHHDIYHDRESGHLSPVPLHCGGRGSAETNHTSPGGVVPVLSQHQLQQQVYGCTGDEMKKLLSYWAGLRTKRQTGWSAES